MPQKKMAIYAIFSCPCYRINLKNAEKLPSTEEFLLTHCDPDQGISGSILHAASCPIGDGVTLSRALISLRDFLASKLLCLNQNQKSEREVRGIWQKLMGLTLRN